MSLKTYYHHSKVDFKVDETLAKIQVQNLQIVGWTLTKEQQLVELNLDKEANP
jgi:hypothetical protein